MMPLRVFLMLRCRGEEWEVSVHRDLETVLKAWKERPEPTRTSGVMHIGFERPPSVLFEPVVADHPGRMLLTASAKYALPRGFETSQVVIGSANGHSVYIGLKGWGYGVSEEELTKIEAAAPKSPIPDQARKFTAEGWVGDFILHHPDARCALQTAGICNEHTYVSNESNLDRDIRCQAGLFRFRTLVGVNTKDHLAIVQAFPPWLLDRGVDTLSVTVRIANGFQNEHIKTVRDLLNYSSEELIRLQNFGRKSLDNLRDSLLDALNEGPFDVQAKVFNAATGNLISHIQRALAELDDRERDVLARRMGVDGKAQVLQEIGDDYSITRERVRQIEAKALKRLNRHIYWDDLFVAKLDSLLHGRAYPLPVLGVEAVDRWFEGLGKHPALVQYLLTNCCGNRISVLTIDGIDYFGRLTRDEWEFALHEARRLLESGAGHRWSEDHCRSAVTALLKDPVGEFRSLLWAKASVLCHFTEERDGQRFLTSYGRGAEQLVEAVLLESETPIHYSEIASRAMRRSGRPFDVRRIHNAAASVGLLFGRGTFGLDKHLKLPADEAEMLRDEMEEAIQNGAEGRQWHVSELCSFLAERNLPLTERLDKYSLEIILRQSTVLRRLGRMTWSTATSDAYSPNYRIDLRQAIIAILEHAGSSLSAAAIRQRLIALRGVNEHFQISAQDPLIRVAPGFWGLNDRDLPIKRVDQAHLIDSVVGMLRDKSAGIHISEIPELNLPHVDHTIPPHVVFSIATRDPRLRVNVGQYIFLTEWGEARRISTIEAVRSVMQEALAPLSLDDIVARVEGKMERACDKQTVSACLQAIDAAFDSVHAVWSHLPADIVPYEENLEEGAA